VILDEDLCKKRGKSNESGGWEIAGNKGNFTNILVMISTAKIYGF